MPKVKHDDPGMRGERSRNATNGQLRQKRNDTHVGTIEAEYGIDLGMRADAHLKTALARADARSLSDLLKNDS